MKNRTTVVLVVAFLLLALVVTLGINQWPLLSESRAREGQAAPRERIAATLNVIDQEAAAELAQVDPTQELLAELYEQVAPSVVNIQVTANAQGEALIPGQEPGLVQGQGSGWIYDNEGHIVTNNHVAGDAVSMTVYFSNGMWAEGTLVAADPAADLAVIKVTPPEGVEWTPLPLAELNSLRVGFTVVAIGSPFGLLETMTTGIVSALGRSVPTESGQGAGSTYSLPDVIQTDTAINPGNSGGPLLNLQGEVVGVNFAINTTSGSSSGVGFAIPISVVQKIIPALINDGQFEYAYIGISGAAVNAPIAGEFGLDPNQLGVYVFSVVEGGPAADAGVQEGDVIVGVNDRPITQFEQLVSYLFNNSAPGDTVTLTLLRGDEEISVDLTLEARPGPSVARPGAMPELEISISEAIDAATAAVLEAGLMDEVAGASAQATVVEGRAVWIVTLTGASRTATVIVDGTTGEVLDLQMQ